MCGAGQQQCPYRHGILAQGGQAHLRAGGECAHDKARQGGGDCFAPGLAYQGKSPSKNDDLWMEQVGRVGKRKGEVLGGLI